MADLQIPFSQGYVSSRDRADLQAGECQTLDGWRYKPGDGNRIHTATTRSVFGDTGSAAKIKGLALIKFDSGGTDRLLAYSGTTIYSATPGATGTFASFISSLNSSGVNLGRVHYDDRWYIGNGYDANKVVESSGTVRTMGMQEPSAGITGAAAATVSSGQRPTAVTASSGFTSTNLAYDTDLTTYAYARLTAAGTATCTWTTFGADATASRRIEIKWGLAGLRTDEAFDNMRDSKEFNVNILLEYSEDSGSNWTTLYTETGRTSAISDRLTTNTVTANSNLIQFRATLTYVDGTKSCSLKVYDIIVKIGSATTNFTTVDGLFYAYTEYSSTYGIESPYVSSAKVTLAAQNNVVLTLPSAAVNSTATHWNIYRTTDGGTIPKDLRLIAQIPISQTQYVDTFELYDKDTPGTTTPRLLKIQPDPDSDALYFSADSPPTAFVHMNAYGPFLVGISPSFPRTLFYCLPGFPESWPVPYQVTSFPLPERDELVCTATVGDTLLIAMTEAMLFVEGLPEATGGLFSSASARPFLGQPGCVSRQGLTAFSIAGEPHAAWISPFGVHLTNGQTAFRISDDLDWSTEVSVSNLSTAVIQWNPVDATLIVAYDSDGGGANDSHFVFHMDPIHRKGNGMPKVSRGTGDVACMAAGMVSGTHRVYSGHTTNGSVYLNWDATSAKVAKTQRVYGQDGKGIDLNVGALYHSDFGSSETATVTTTTVDDANGDSQSESETVSLVGQGEDPFWIALAGQSFEMQVEYDGTAEGSILYARADVRTRGKAGKTL